MYAASQEGHWPRPHLLSAESLLPPVALCCPDDYISCCTRTSRWGCWAKRLREIANAAPSPPGLRYHGAQYSCDSSYEETEAQSGRSTPYNCVALHLYGFD